jgi:hypothetical protein
VCLAGARAAHDQILQKNHSAALRVYAIWISFYPWDAKSDIDPGILEDPRVTQFWDPGKVTARWFADHVSGDSGGIAWDAYFVYGPSSHWTSSPSNLLATASPVVNNLDALKGRLAPAS